MRRQSLEQTSFQRHHLHKLQQVRVALNLNQSPNQRGKRSTSLLPVFTEYGQVASVVMTLG